MQSNLITKIKELNLPEGQYMICGSAILDILGIRPAKDIDLLVTPELFEDLKKNQGWEPHSKYSTTISHPQGLADAKQTLDFMKENHTFAQSLEKATFIEGIPFMGLEFLIEAKKQLNREKDIADIETINEYMESN